jgi:hypothetical protein
MEHLKNVAIVTGKLATLIDGYIGEFRHNGDGFHDFSDEAIIYALLEYSKFPRDFTKSQRIVYIHDKCLEYEGREHFNVTVEFDEQYDTFVVLCYPQKSSGLPF